MLTTSFVLMLSGMGVVFSFLIVLVLVTQVTSNLVGKYERLHPAPETKKTPAQSPAPPSDEMAKIAAVIAVAQKEFGIS